MSDARRMLDWDIGSTIASYIASALSVERAPSMFDIHPYRNEPPASASGEQPKIGVSILGKALGVR